jgi:putative peptidoglycan lipid II flippase
MSERQGLGRASAVMAVGTAASRASGFVRTIVIAAAVGSIGALADAYNTANTLPNVVYDLLLGGVLSAVVVPVLVQARDEDADGGAAFAQALLSVIVVALVAVTVVAELAAPWLIHLYLAPGEPPQVRAQAVEFARWFLPQILFYGITAAVGAVLNSRGRFGAPTAVPVLNNLVVIATALIYLALPGHGASPLGLTGAQTLVLAGGTTLGVVVMGLALLPALRTAGVPWRWRFGLRHPGLGRTARLAGWVVVYVVLSQVAFLVVTRLASDVQRVSAYSYAYQLFQLPYAIVGVSVVTALLPAMSAHAAAGRLGALRGEVSRGLRLAGTLVVPAALVLAALAVPIAVATLGSGRSSPTSAREVGRVLAVLALGLVPFTIQQLLLRAFYARQDSRTPAALAALVTGVLVAVDLGVAALNDRPSRVIGLAAGFAVAYTVGAAVAARLLLRQLDGRGHRVLRLYVRVSLASVMAAAAGWLAAQAAAGLVPGAGVADGVAASVVGLAAALPSYLVVARRMRIRELDPLLRLVTARLRGPG